MEMESKYMGHMNNVDNGTKLEIPKVMTIREMLMKLPLQKRLQAIENIRKTESYFSLKERMDMENSSCILLFTYANTRQGHDYWWKINQKYFL